MEAKFPRCPQGLNLDTYHHYVELKQCSRLTSGYCSESCEHLLQDVDKEGFYPVEFDHVDATSNGGSDSPYNIRPVCRSYNRFKSNKDESDYKQLRYFDQEICPVTLSALRPWQAELYQTVSTGQLSQLYKEPSLGLLATFAVLTWCVGAGKTLGWVLFALAINKARGYKGVRVKRVLFLVQQRDLVANIAAELQGSNKEKSDIEKYLDIRPPKVFQLTDADQWDNSECLAADIVATCPQALWRFKDDEKSRKTKELRKQYLSSFDLIVIDEGHFAVHQYADFLKDAPMAFKLIMSATPMDGSGKYLSSIPDYGSRFRYINIFADYNTVRDFGQLKILPTWEEGTAATPQEWYADDEASSSYVNGPSYFCQPSQNATYLNQTGAVEVDPLSPNHAIETSLMLANKVDDYSAQILVKAENRHIAKNIVKHLNGEYGDKFADAIYTGNKSGERLTKNHPWMKGKSTVLVAIDMAQFGLNRPECTVICWVAKNLSYVEIIQRIGRALRIVKGVPAPKQKARLVWSDPSMTPFIKRAIEIMHNGNRDITANFQDLAGLIDDGVVAYTELPDLVPTVPGLTEIDKRQIERLVGTAPNLTPSETNYKNLAETLAGVNATDEAKEKMLEMVKDYSDEIRQPEWIRSRVVDVDSKPIGWLRLKLTAEPDPNSITEDELVDYIQSMRIPTADKKCLLLMLKTSEEYRAEIFQRVQDSRRNTFMPMANGYHPTSIVGINSKRGEIDESYRKDITVKHFKNGTKEDHIERAKVIRTAIVYVLKNALGIEEFSDSEKGYKAFCSQLSTALMTERIRNLIIKMATDYCYKNHPEMFKPYPDFLEAANNATH